MAQQRAMVAQLFRLLDRDSNGYVGSTEYKSFLEALGMWGMVTHYTDCHWPLTWARICQHLGGSCHYGITEVALARRYIVAPKLLGRHLSQARTAARIHVRAKARVCLLSDGE